MNRLTNIDAVNRALAAQRRAQRPLETADVRHGIDADTFLRQPETRIVRQYVAPVVTIDGIPVAGCGCQHIGNELDACPRHMLALARAEMPDVPLQAAKPRAVEGLHWRDSEDSKGRPYAAGNYRGEYPVQRPAERAAGKHIARDARRASERARKADERRAAIQNLRERLAGR